MVGAVVLKVRHQGSLAVEQLGFGKPTPARSALSLLPAGDGAHAAVLIGQIGGHLPAGCENGLVAVDALREM